MPAVKKLPHRRWDELRDLWIDHLPDVDFSTDFPEPTLWHLPELAERLQVFKDGVEVPYIDGARQSVFREAVLLCRKFSYCRSLSLEANARGFPTWSVIAAYDACFYGAKAFCYFLGVASLGRHSKLFLDLFPSRTIGKGKHKRTVYDTLIAYDLEEHLTHKTLWNVAGRLCRTLKLPESHSGLSAELRAISFDGVSNYRNNLAYDGGFWLDSDDAPQCDLTRSISNIRLFRAVEKVPSPCDESERYFSIADVIHRTLYVFLKGVADLAPALGPEVIALEDWRSRSTA